MQDDEISQKEMSIQRHKIFTLYRIQIHPNQTDTSAIQFDINQSRMMIVPGTPSGPIDDQQEESFSLEDMFTRDISFLENNIFRLKQDVTINSIKHFDFV